MPSTRRPSFSSARWRTRQPTKKPFGLPQFSSPPDHGQESRLSALFLGDTKASLPQQPASAGRGSRQQPRRHTQPDGRGVDVAQNSMRRALYTLTTLKADGSRVGTPSTRTGPSPRPNSQRGGHLRIADAGPMRPGPLLPNGGPPRRTGPSTRPIPAPRPSPRTYRDVIGLSSSSYHQGRQVDSTFLDVFLNDSTRHVHTQPHGRHTAYHPPRSPGSPGCLGVLPGGHAADSVQANEHSPQRGPREVHKCV